MHCYHVTVAGEYLGVWDLDEVDLNESFALQEATGLDPILIQHGLGRLNPTAWRGVVWHLRRKQNPKLRIDQINFKWGDLEATEAQEGEAVPPPGAETNGDGTSADDATSGSTRSRASSATRRKKSTV